MAVQRAVQRNRSSLVKQDPHSGQSRSRTSGDMLQHRAGLLQRHSGEKFDEISQGDAVFQVLASRFSNRAATGIRVPRNTHAPLTRWESRSTAVQPAQPSSRCVLMAPFWPTSERFVAPTGSLPRVLSHDTQVLSSAAQGLNAESACFGNSINGQRRVFRTIPSQFPLQHADPHLAKTELAAAGGL